MATATSTTGQANQAPRRSVAKTGAALSIGRAISTSPRTIPTRSDPRPSTARHRTLAQQATSPVFARSRTPAQGFEVPSAQFNSMLHCYIRSLIVTTRQSPLHNHAKINRQPPRLEATVTLTKQTPATQINRQLSGTSSSAIHNLPITNKTPSNRQWQILEFTVTHTKQTTAPRSNRHFLRCLNLQIQQPQELCHTRLTLDGLLSARNFQPAPLVPNRNNPSFKIAAKSLKINAERNPNRNTNRELRITPHHPRIANDAFPPHRLSCRIGAENLMTRLSLLLVIMCGFAMTFAGAAPVLAQKPTASASSSSHLSTHWEELTAADFHSAIVLSGGTCILPFGILEKHGPQLPLGTDLINVRFASLTAAADEYAVVFPEYYFGQIFEAKHEPGTIAYSANLQMRLLQETTDEMARNGCKKILIVNGHGGNEHLLPFFAQAQLDKPHDYVVYVQWGHEIPAGGPAKKTTLDMHAGESETARVMVSRPDLVHLDRAASESGADQNRVHLPEDVYTGIWWYARFPNHYAGDGSAATLAYGEADMKAWVKAIVAALRAVKADDVSLKLQKEFYERSQHPLDTPQ